MEQIYAFLPLLILAAMFWFLIIRPQRARQAEAAATRARVAVGRRVMTTAGLFGTVVGVEDDEVLLEIAPGVVVRYVAAAIAKVIEEGAPEAAGPSPVQRVEDGDTTGA